ncbi:MAG: hypothetical protein FJ138_09720 [Deltaproteobacteria bacterium]|nr:hypothetical protein [Deltaproteobacteria bacterium]
MYTPRKTRKTRETRETRETLETRETTNTPRAHIRARPKRPSPQRDRQRRSGATRPLGARRESQSNRCGRRGA